VSPRGAGADGGAGPPPVERVRGSHPTDASWRADALARSRHARLLDQLVEPLEERDLERAGRVCAAVCRATLADFAPGLILLPPGARRRLQAFVAWSATLFDFARQGGLEGERLAQMNRWEYELERALAGEPAGQPVFLLLAAEQEARPWPEQVFASVARTARRRAAEPRPATADEAARDARRLAGAALAGCAPEAAAEEGPLELVATLVRLRHLVGLGEAMRRGQAGLGREELPEAWQLGRSVSPLELTTAVLREAERLRPALAGPGPARSPWPPALRPAACYARLAGRRLLAQVERRGGTVVGRPPRLGIATRLLLLAGARLAG
jgi:hypothetical protein